MNWESLNLSEKSELMKLYLKNGITSLSDMKEHYNSYQGGGGLKKIITNTINKIHNPFQADKETLKRSEDVNRQNAEKYQEDGPLKIPSYIRQSGILNYDITLPRKIQWNKNLKNGVLYNRGYETAPDGVTITKAGRPIIAMPTFNDQFNNDNIGDEVVVTYYDKELNRKIPVKHIVGDWKDSSKDALGPFGSHIKYPKHRKKPFYSFIEPWMESKNSLEKSSLWKGIYNSDNNFENNLPPNVVIESIEPTGHNIIDDPKYFETVDDNFTGLIFLDPIEITAERN